MRKLPLFMAWKFWLICLYIIKVASTQIVIKSNTIVGGNNPSGFQNGYIVSGDAFLAFQDMNTVPMYQTVRIDKGGALYYINNDKQGFSILSDHNYNHPFVFLNEGTVVVDDRRSISPGSWTIKDGSFTNNGNIMFTSSQGDIFSIGSNYITNTGFIFSKGTSFEKPQRLQIGNGNIWINTGTVCMANTTYILENAIQGGGWHEVPVYGLGNGNGILYPDAPIRDIYYDSSTGIMDVTAGTNGIYKFTVYIGAGYNESNFEIVSSIKIHGISYDNYNFVRYRGPPPNLAPSVCQPCVEIPLYSFQVPDPYTTTNELGFSETVSFYSTYNENDIPVIGNTTIYVPPAIYTLTKVNENTTETDIISRVTGMGYNGLPFTYYTTITVGEMETGVVTKTITITENKSRSTKTTLMSRNYTFSFSNYSPISSSGTYSVSTVDNITTLTDTVANVSSSGPNSIVTATMTTYQNNHEFNNASVINVTNSSNIMVPITSTFYSSVDSNLTTPITSLTRTSQSQIVSHITKLASSINETTIASTFPSPAASGTNYTTVVTNAEGSVQTDIVSHITTTDSDGKPTTIVSHITTTDSDGKPTTIVTTFPAPAASGADYTTVVTNADGSVETDIVSHITTKDSIGKPTTVVTTVPYTLCASNADYTTVVTKSNVSVETEVVSHITTTAPCSDLESHVESQTTSPSMHTTSLVGSENGVSAKTVNDKPNPTSVTEVAVSEGTTSNAGYVTDQGSSLEMFAPTGASAVESGNKVSQTQTASIFHGAGSTFKIKFNTILLSTSLTILILLGMA
ncbi:Cell wall protein IFF4 [Nakaseomyces glabratus]|uniref:Cell wall protein IFF4 n=1 Tax=Candida glabrata TaxID=5478 RepID=A0A0W0DHD7_CANGB|nr:Cell wall protein IFF4 [Nakaseomyces glabratus]